MATSRTSRAARLPPSCDLGSRPSHPPRTPARPPHPQGKEPQLCTEWGDPGPHLPPACLPSGPHPRPLPGGVFSLEALRSGLRKGTGDLLQPMNEASGSCEQAASTKGPRGGANRDTCFPFKTSLQLRQSELKYFPWPRTEGPLAASLADPKVQGPLDFPGGQGHQEPRGSWHHCPKEPDL